MSECKSCGGFVTDNYARVFGDNDDNVFDCRNCRTDRRLGSDESDDGDEDKVLLRTVRETDGAGADTRASATAVSDGGSVEPTDTESRTHENTSDDTEPTDQPAREPAAEPAASESDDDGRSGIRGVLSKLWS